MIGIDLPDHDTADGARAGVLRARPARAHVRRALDPPGPAARRHRGAGRHRRGDPRRRPRRAAGAVDEPLPTTDRRWPTRVGAILAACGADAPAGDLAARTPITGGSLGAGRVGRPTSTPPSSGPPRRSPTWRTTPAPVRGNLVRRLGELLREHKDDLGELVSIEAGKIRSEGLGEVQEMIDICDFAVGLSRQLHGLTIASERPGHRLMETWHPMGPCAVITAFNFPVAVWSWNAALALVCRRPGAVEAVGQDAAHGAGLRRPAPPGRRRRRRAGRAQPGAPGRRRRRRRARRPRGRGDRVGHRLDAHGPRRRARRGRRASAG